MQLQISQADKSPRPHLHCAALYRHNDLHVFEALYGVDYSSQARPQLGPILDGP